MNLLKKTILLFFTLVAFTQFSQAQTRKAYKKDGYKIFFDKSWKKSKRCKKCLECMGYGVIVATRKSDQANAELNSQKVKLGIYRNLIDITKKRIEFKGKDQVQAVKEGMQFENIKIDGTEVLKGSYTGRVRGKLSASSYTFLANTYAFKNKKGEIQYILIFEIALRGKKRENATKLNYAINSIETMTSIYK
ncbi:hypothetical protein BKI52_19865 [marine bacterium AO1-C]|nr:hypothetical protein BKI52_19865 [marine bacterium AO1-C]